MKKVKKMKTSQKNKSRVRKQKVRNNGKKRVNRQVFSEDDLIDFNVEESPFSAFVAVYVMKNDEPMHLLQFETDINSVKAAVDFAEPISRIDNLHVDRIHDRLAGILSSANLVKDDLEKIIINYLGCFQAEIALAEFPDQHIGYALYFDVNDNCGCRLRGGPRADIEDLFNAVIGKPINEELSKQLVKKGNGN